MRSRCSPRPTRKWSPCVTRAIDPSPRSRSSSTATKVRRECAFIAPKHCCGATCGRALTGPTFLKVNLKLQLSETSPMGEPRPAFVSDELDDLDRLFARLDRAAVPDGLTTRVLASTVGRADATRAVFAWPWL